jgi:hypothetical protein
MRRLSAFMNGFAEVVRLPEPDRRPCDLGRLIDEIVLLLRPSPEPRIWPRAQNMYLTFQEKE